MATAKLKNAKSHMTGKTVKVECPECYDEFGSEACIRPAHGTFAHMENIVKDIENSAAGKEILAAAILQISDSVKRLERTGLNRRAVVALIADDTKLGKKTIETVLNSLGELAKNYTVQPRTGTNSAGPR